ncbi:MAG TPA: PAS domain S-box protein [Vicinamibacterales bacterium]|nr:PAS domain S-box protein [Vicinamibacterales bacterium]
MTDPVMARVPADDDDWTLETDLRCSHDLAGRLLSISAAAAHALGYEVDDLLNVPLGDLIAPEFRSSFHGYLQAIRRSGNETGRLTLQTRAGALLVWEYLNSLHDHDGQPIVIGAARDVTERVRSEQALKASEDRFVTAFYSSPIAMAITTVAEGRYIDVNEAFERQMGYPRDEICGHTSLELDVWPTPADRQTMVAALLRQKTIRDQDAQFRTKSGRLITTLYSAGLITLHGDRCVLAAIADITAQKLAEQALRESESKFRMLAETTQSGIFIYRETGALCYFNPRMEHFTGYSASELDAMTVWDLVHPDSIDMVRARARARWRGVPAPSRYELKIVTKSGDTRWLDLSASLIEFQGQPAIVGTAFDITDSKRTEQQAREYTALLQTLISNSPYGIVMGDKDHHIRFCNAAFQRIFQYTDDEIIGRDPDDLIGPTDSSEAHEISRRVLNGEVVHATGVRRRRDGSKVDVEFHAVPLIASGEFVGCFGIYQDITERIRSEAKLRALRDRLTRVQDEERAHIARELHDDIGQRLALLAIQLAQLPKDAQAAPDLHSRLDASRLLAEEICADAQRISHRLHPSQLGFLGLKRALASLCREFARQTDVKIDFVCGDNPKLPPEIDTCLYRVAQEAIQNATKHSRCRAIRVELAARADAICLRVSDDGRGFDPTAADHNSGLGLVSMAERVRAAGGELAVQSTVGHGAQIEVSIPLPQPIER